MTQSTQNEHEHKKYTFFVDNEKFESATEILTVRQILVDYAKEDPSTTVLEEKNGNTLTPLTNLDEPITLKNGMKFVVIHTGPTTVS